MSTWEQYQTAYQAANITTKRLLDSSVIPDCVETHQLPNDQHRATVRIFSELTLNLHTDDDAISALSEAGVPDAETVFSTVKTCIANTEVPEPTAAERIAEKHPLVTEPITTQSISSTYAEPTTASTTIGYAPQPTTIDQIRQQALMVWGQYLSAPIGIDTTSYKEQVSALAKELASVQQGTSDVSASTDPRVYWHEVVTRTRGRLPQVDAEAVQRIHTEFGANATEPKSIVSSIKGSAG